MHDNGDTALATGERRPHRSLGAGFPLEVDESLYARWVKERQTNPSVALWLDRIGGWRMENIKNETQLLLSIENIRRESMSAFGLGYARLFDVQNWHGGVDATHPFIYLRGSEFGSSHALILREIQAQSALVLRSLEMLEPTYSQDLSEWLYGEQDRDVLIGLARRAPTEFTLGLATGLMVLCEWRDHELPLANKEI